MTNNEMAKGGGIKQTRPQETDSTYSKAIDKQVAGKPVGYRFTDKLAKKLGKKPGTKPTAAEIEKYKNRGVYFETRKNKSDLNPKAKLAGGGKTKEFLDWNDIIGRKIGSWEATDNNDISILWESDKSEYYFFASPNWEGERELSIQIDKNDDDDFGILIVSKNTNAPHDLQEYLSEIKKVISIISSVEKTEKELTTSDFKKDFKDVKYRNPRKLAGGGDMEYAKGGQTKSHYIELDVFDFDSSMKRWCKRNDITYKIIEEEGPAGGAPLVKFFGKKEDLKSLIDKYYGENNDVEEWYEEIKSYAKGGQTSPQRESYSKRGDKEVKAKPVGYRFTEKLANRLGKNEYTKPTQEQIEKYSGKKNGIYFENRKDKSDINPRAKFMHGGHNDEVLGNGRKLDHFTAVGIAEGFVEKQDWNDELKAWAYIQRHGLTRSLQGWFGRTAEEMIDRGLFDRKGNIDWEVANEIWDEDDEYAKGGQTKSHYIELDVFDFDSSMKRWCKRNDITYKIIEEEGPAGGAPLVKFFGKKEDLKSLIDKYYSDNDDVEFWYEEIKSYAKGGQTSPQRESYNKRGDKEVKAKPVGYRFTEKLANRLGKNVYTKPTQEQVEKYRGRGVYFENRKDKSDINPRAMFEEGGDMEYAKGGKLGDTFVEAYDYGESQGYIRDFGTAQMEVKGKEKEVKLAVLAKILDIYSATSDEQFENKPFQVSFEIVPYLNEIDKKLLEKAIDNSNTDISKITNKDIHIYGDVFEGYTSGVPLYLGELYLPLNNHELFETQEQAEKFIKSKKVKDEITVSGRLLGFYLDRPLNSIGTTGWSYLEHILDESHDPYRFAKGGQTAPQRESYSKRGDKEVKAKPVGYRFTEKLANRLGKNVFTKPTQEQVEKYRGRGVYFENRKDKSDINPRAMFEEGGEMARGGKYEDLRKRFEGYTNEELQIFNGDNKETLKHWNRKDAIEDAIKSTIDEQDGEYARGGQTAPQRESYSRRGDKEVSAKPVGYRFTNALAKRLGKKVTTRPSTEEVRKYLGKGIYFENRKDKSDVNPKAKLMGGGDTDYAKGGKIANQYTSIKRDKKWGQVANLWNAWTPTQRKHFMHDHTDELEISLYDYPHPIGLEKITWDRIENWSDDVANELGDAIRDHIEMGQYAKGGQTAPQQTDSTYSKSIDKRVSGKPVGYRFTNKLANKLGKKPFTRPTAAEIEKYSGKGVYFETRKNKSDINPKAKLEGGGESEYARGGGVPRTSNADSKAYTENHLPFMANNLEGKTLENGDYVVLSYGYYPIWFWHKRTNKWYGNKDKFSVTTAKHISQSRPTYDAQMLSRGEMDNLMSKSIEGKDFKEMGGTLESFEVAQP